MRRTGHNAGTGAGTGTGTGPGILGEVKRVLGVSLSVTLVLILDYYGPPPVAVVEISAGVEIVECRSVDSMNNQVVSGT